VLQATCHDHYGINPQHILEESATVTGGKLCIRFRLAHNHNLAAHIETIGSRKKNSVLNSRNETKEAKPL